MTPSKTYSFIRKAKDMTISGSLAFLVMGQASLMQSCNSQNEQEADYEITESYAQGVKTYIKETAPGEFKITDEIAVPADSSQAIITYLDGRTETLNKEQSKGVIDKDMQTNQAGIGTNNSLSNVLLYGGMGYFLGRTMSPGYMAYRPDMRRDDRNNGYSGGGSYGRYYSDQNTYNKSNSVKESINKSRTMVARPTGAKSGFFGRSSRGGFGS